MRQTFLALTVLAAATTNAQSAPKQPNSTPVMATSGAFFALIVPDLDASTTWYREKLGLRVIMNVPRTDQTKAAVTVLSGSGLTVELLKRDDALSLQSLARSSEGGTFVHGIMKVGMVVDDFDGTVARLRSRGVDPAMGPFPKRGDQPANVIIRDNAGNLIQILGK